MILNTSTKYLVDPSNHTGYTQTLEEYQGNFSSATNSYDYKLRKSYIIGDDVLAQTAGSIESSNPASTQLRTDYLLYDGHGSTRQLIGTVDNSRTAEFSNLRISTYDFDAYGIELPQTATSQAKPQANSEETNLRYSGEFFDKDLNQQYLRARYYNQNNGQFNRLDPYSGNLSDPQSLHKYAYCHQDPVNHIDPSGNFSLVEVAVVSTIIGVLTGMHHYYNLTNKMSVWNSVIFAFFTTVTVALSIIFAPVIASAMSGIILSGGALLEISALIMIPLAINYGGTLLEAVDIIFDSKKSVMERISAIGYLVAQLVTFWSAFKASKGISKSAPKSTGAPKSGGRMAQLKAKYGHMTRAQRQARIAKLAERKVPQPGKTVLGHYPEYVELANKLGSRKFSLPDKIWKNMSETQIWTANRKFLDRVIGHGDDIILATPLNSVRGGSYLQKELQYLFNKGFKPSADGTRLIPGI